MWRYILGIVLGASFMISMLIILFIYLFKKIKHNKMLKIITLKAEIKINNDIQTWARQTKNLFIPKSLYKYEKNKMFGVDSILITPQALFVIEIKSFKGIVQGDAHLSYWLKNQQFKIINPIVQNEKHIEHIIKMIKIKVPTISLIIFSNKSDLLDIKNIPNHVLVFRHSKLFEILDGLKTLKISLSEYEMRTIYSIIRSFITNKYKDKKFFKKITSNKR